MKARVRFAPSPTGYLHIGGARTALFNWLYARHTGGTFVLRIEDTDVARNSQEAVEVILNGLRWLGLDWDEGPISSDVTGASKGDVKRELTDREQVDPDFVIVRSDGQPVFHFVNVVDDLEMNITHVVRGEDHLSNTAKHVALFKAFGVEPPKYAHIPLILNIDGTKMGKRDKGASLSTHIEEGYAPEALVNYLCLLGWSPKHNREKMPLKEVIEAFDLPQILRANARFDLAKLNWLNGEYIREMDNDRFYELSIHALTRAGFDPQKHRPEYVKAALDTCKGKFRIFSELPAYAGFYFSEQIDFDPEAAKKELTSENSPRLQRLREELAKLEPFSHDTIGAKIAEVAKSFDLKTGVLVHPTRLACSGKPAGPSLYHLMAIIGREKVLERLDRAIERIG
jgi:glutamyl-tRNA synthetase